MRSPACLPRMAYVQAAAGARGTAAPALTPENPEQVLQRATHAWLWRLV